jgi:hypothetical protein
MNDRPVRHPQIGQSDSIDEHERAVEQARQSPSS